MGLFVRQQHRQNFENICPPMLKGLLLVDLVKLLRLNGAYLHAVQVKYSLLTAGYSKSGNPKAKQTAWLPVHLVNKILL